MGDEVAGTGKPIKATRKIDAVSTHPVVVDLAARHKLPADHRLGELLDHLDGLSCRDQEEEDPDRPPLSERRRVGYALAKSMQKEAQVMVGSLARLHRDFWEFQAQVGFNPALLEEIFDVDLEGPKNIFLPFQLGIFQDLFGDDTCEAPIELIDNDPHDSLEVEPSIADAHIPQLWDVADYRLQQVSDLPVRPRLRSGPVPNHMLRTALVACRSYWLDKGNTWSMSLLKSKATRKANQTRYLKGDCEKFVSDALTTSGIWFKLSDLHSAWESVDAEERRANACR